MSRWYKRHVGTTLKQAIAQACEVSPDDQLAVFEELALMREAAGQFVAIHSALVEQNAKPEALAVSALGMQDALSKVIDAASKAAKAYEKAKGFTLKDLEFITNQLTGFLAEVCGEEHRDIAEQFLRHIDEHLIMPEKGSAEPTTLKAADTVALMDATVPYVAGDDDDDEES